MNRILASTLAIIAIPIAGMSYDPPEGNVPHIVYVHDGTGRIVGLPPEGQTRTLDRGAVVIYSDGSVSEISPSSISSPKLKEKLHVEIRGRRYIVPKPNPGETCKLLSHGTTYVIDHEGNWRDSRTPMPRKLTASNRNVSAMGEDVVSNFSTNALNRYNMEIDKVLSRIQKSRENNDTNLVFRLERRLFSMTNETGRSELLARLSLRYPDPPPFPEHPVYGKPDDPDSLKYRKYGNSSRKRKLHEK